MVPSIPGKGDVVSELKLNENVCVTVSSNAKVIIGGQFSGGNYYSGQTYGSYSQVVMGKGSSIIVKSSAVLSCMGYITGFGSITVEANGALYEPLIITNFGGGSYVKDSISSVPKVAPFTSYAIMNVQVETYFEANANLYGYVTVYITSISKYYIKTILFLGGDHSSALFLTSGDTAFSYCYCADKGECKHSIKDHFPVNGRNGIGRTTVQFSDNTQIGSLYIDVPILGAINSENFSFPLSYNFTVEQLGGTLEISKKLNMMAGSKLIISPDAALDIKSSGSLVVMNGTADDNNPNANVTSANLKAVDMSERARLIVNGNMNVSGTFGGKVETDGTGTITFASNNLTATVKEGTNGYVTYTVPTQLMIHDTKYSKAEKWTTISSAGTYHAVSAEEWTPTVASELQFTYSGGDGNSPYTYKNYEAHGTWSKSEKVYDNGSEVSTTAPSAPADSVIYYSDASFTKTVEEAPNTGVVYYKVCDHVWDEDECTNCGLPRYSVNGETVTYYHDAINAIAAAYDGDKMVVCDVQTDGVDTFTLTGLKSDMTVKIFLLDANYAPIAGYEPKAKTVK